MTRRKNPFGKTVKKDTPYAVYQGPADFEWRILKTYQIPENCKKNRYARWLVAAKSDLSYGGFELGDTYRDDIQKHGKLVECTDEWREHYG